MKKLTKISKMLLLLILSVVFAIEPAVPVYSEGNAQQSEALYVSEIAVGHIDDLKSNNYVVSDYMINPTWPNYDDEYGDYAFPLYIGFKTTTDKSQAITDVALLGTNDGFEKLDIKSRLSAQKEGYREFVGFIRSAVSEYKANLDKGNIYAQTAKKALDYIYVPGETEDTDMSLTDYLINENTTDDNIIELVMIGVSNLQTVLTNQLCFAVTDDITKDGTTSWLDRLCKNGPFVMLDANGNPVTDEGKIEQAYVDRYDGRLGDSARYLSESVESFIAEYKSALKRYPDGNINGILTEAEIEKAADARNENVGKTVDGTVTLQEGDHIGEITDLSVEQQKINDAYHIFIYNALNERDENGTCRYPFGTKSDGTQRSVAEYLLETVESKPDESESFLDYYRRYYPLLQNSSGERVLTEGQAAMMYLTGFEAMYQNLTLTSEDFKTTTAEIEKYGKEITDELGGPISVWYGVNKDVFDNELNVCWTSNAMRQDAAKKRLDEIIKPSTGGNSSKYLNLYQKVDKIDRAVQLGGMVGTLVSIVCGIAGKGVESFAVATATISAAIKGLKTAYSVGAAVCCCIAKVISVAMVVVDLAFLLFWAFAVSIYVEDTSYDMKEYDKSVIPDIVFDLIENEDGSSYSAEYKAVRYPGASTTRTYDHSWIDNGPGVKDEKIIFPYGITYHGGDKVDIESRVMIVKSNKYHDVRMQQWVVMYYTKDASAGEPITVAKDENGNDVTFTAKRNQYNPEDGYTGLHSFGTYAARNMTMDLGKKAGQDFDYNYELFLFMHKDSPEKTLSRTQKKYVSDAKIKSYPNNQAEAAIRELKASGYLVFEKNLTQGSSYSSYLGIKTTDRADKALTDMRFAYAPGVDIQASKLYFGNASTRYIGSGGVGLLGLFVTDSPCAGTPMLSNSVTVVDSMDEIPEDEGYEPVNTFSGGPALDLGLGGSWGADNTVLPVSYNRNYHAYIYFKCRTVFTSKDANGNANTQYIGGLSFVTGCNAESYAEELGWSILSTTDLSGHQYVKLLEPNDVDQMYFVRNKIYNDRLLADGESLKTYLCYSTTYNPYRAIYDIKTYTAETTSTGIQYNINYANTIDGELSGFVACDVFQQGPSSYGKIDNELYQTGRLVLTSENPNNILPKNARCLRYSHTYRSRNVNEGGCDVESEEAKTKYTLVDTSNIDTYDAIIYESRYVEVEAYVDGATEWYHTDDGKTIFRDITPVGMYVMGCNTADITKAQPLKVGDIVCQDSTVYKGAKPETVKGKKTISYTPVRDLTDYYSENAANLGYQDNLTDLDVRAINMVISGKREGSYRMVDYGGTKRYFNVHACNEVLALFLKRPDYNYNNKGKYVSSVTVAYAGDGYKDKDEKGEEVTKSTESPIDECKMKLISQGAGKLIELNLAGNTTDEKTTNGICTLFYTYNYNEYIYRSGNRTKQRQNEILNAVFNGSYHFQDTNYGDEIAYLWVTYTTKSSNAISELHIFESEDKKAADNEIELPSGSTATKCGDSFRYNDGTTYYTLYAVKNKGNMVTDFDVGTDVMIDGYKTAITTTGTLSSYQGYFFHTKHTKANKRLTTCISKLATGSGETVREAQLELLSNGCQMYLPLHIVHANGEVVYFGYNTSTDTDDAYTGFLIENAEQNKKLNKIIVGRESYYKIGQNLNAPAVFDAIMSLYATKSKRKAMEYNEDDPHYIEDFMFWNDDALAECFDGYEEEEIVEKIEDYLASLPEEEADELRDKVLDIDSDGTKTPIRWDIVRNSDDEAVNIAFGSDTVSGDRLVLDSGRVESYMFVHYSDNFVLSDFDLLEGALFGNTSTAVTVSCASILILAAAAYIVISKKKKTATRKNETDSAE